MVDPPPHCGPTAVGCGGGGVGAGWTLAHAPLNRQTSNHANIDNLTSLAHAPPSQGHAPTAPTAPRPASPRTAAAVACGMPSMTDIVAAGLNVADVFDPPQCADPECHVQRQHTKLAVGCSSQWAVLLGREPPRDLTPLEKLRWRWQPRNSRGGVAPRTTARHNR